MSTSNSLGPKKSLLKFKSPSSSSSVQSIKKLNNKTVVQTAKLNQELQKQEDKAKIAASITLQGKSEPVAQSQNKQQQPNTKTAITSSSKSYKTESEQAYEMVKKHRMIHKLHDKAKTTNKQRLQKLNKYLTKLPDHFDLAKTGDKIQKGY